MCLRACTVYVYCMCVLCVPNRTRIPNLFLLPPEPSSKTHKFEFIFLHRICRGFPTVTVGSTPPPTTWRLHLPAVRWNCYWHNPSRAQAIETKPLTTDCRPFSRTMFWRYVACRAHEGDPVEAIVKCKCKCVCGCAHTNGDVFF